MPNVSVSIPENLQKQMNLVEDVNWSAVARKAFEERINQIHLLKKIAGKSKLTQKDADEISRSINRSIAERFRSMK